jgi:hypothetical protein
MRRRSFALPRQSGVERALFLCSGSESEAAHCASILARPVHSFEPTERGKESRFELLPGQVHQDLVVAAAIEKDGAAQAAHQLEADSLVDPQRALIVAIYLDFDGMEAAEKEAILADEPGRLCSEAAILELSFTDTDEKGSGPCPVDVEQAAEADQSGVV